MLLVYAYKTSNFDRRQGRLYAQKLHQCILQWNLLQKNTYKDFFFFGAKYRRNGVDRLLSLQIVPTTSN